MYTGVGPPSCRNCMGAWFQLGECSFDCTLYGWLIGLPLPPGKGRTMVFDLESITWHVSALSKGPLADKWAWLW